MLRVKSRTNMQLTLIRAFTVSAVLPVSKLSVPQDRGHSLFHATLLLTQFSDSLLQSHYF